MFNIFEGNADERELKFNERMDILKRARIDGFFDEPIYFKDGLKPIPEIVADGQGPDDTIRPRPFVKHHAPLEHDDRYCPHAVSKGLSCAQCGRGPDPTPTHKYYTSQPCNLCNDYTRHVSYGTGTPVWHCTLCCACDFCLDELTLQQLTTGPATMRPMPMAGQKQVAAGHEVLHDALKTPIDQLFFCTKCGAGLRCGVCNNTGTGRYCDLCGKKDTGKGFCTDCWKEEDTDGPTERR